MNDQRRPEDVRVDFTMPAFRTERALERALRDFPVVAEAG